jgi:hypothetical protein
MRLSLSPIGDHEESGERGLNRTQGEPDGTDLIGQRGLYSARF